MGLHLSLIVRSLSISDVYFSFCQFTVKFIKLVQVLVVMVEQFIFQPNDLCDDIEFGFRDWNILILKHLINIFLDLFQIWLDWYPFLNLLRLNSHHKISVLILQYFCANLSQSFAFLLLFLFLLLLLLLLLLRFRFGLCFHDHINDSFGSSGDLSLFLWPGVIHLSFFNFFLWCFCICTSLQSLLVELSNTILLEFLLLLDIRFYLRNRHLA